MAESRQALKGKPLAIRSDWVTGPRISQWDALWARLFAYAMDHQALPDEIGVARRDPSESEPSRLSSDD